MFRPGVHPSFSSPSRRAAIRSRGLRDGGSPAARILWPQQKSRPIGPPRSHSGHPEISGSAPGPQQGSTYSITSSARASNVAGNVDPERLGGLEVDHKLVLGRRLHRQVGRLLALEDAIHVPGRLPVLFGLIRPVGDQAAGGDEVAGAVDRGQIDAGPPAW